MSSATVANPLEAFAWMVQPRAQELVARLVRDFLSRSQVASQLSHDLYEQAGIRFADLIDAIHVPVSASLRRELDEAGFVRGPVEGAPQRHVQEQGIFPAIVPGEDSHTTIDVKVESMADFLLARQIDAGIEGPPLGALRIAIIDESADTRLRAVERHGYRGFAIPDLSAHDSVAILAHSEALRLRRRAFAHEDQGFAHATGLIDEAITDLGVDRTCDLFFAAERDYWQMRNRAARVQKARQDRIGIGWANHDHHTYRSSREHFAKMIQAFEKLGFHCRERFYAGAEAGWGAQVLEQPRAGIVIFADVDLSPDELLADFAHEGLPPRKDLGTVGLWCKLHGEAFLEAGMHHLECQFDFDALKRQLEEQEGVRVMKPFTNFPFLRQAFTEGEIWAVRPQRIERLLKEGRITPEQAEGFRQRGAIGSHLENLERNEGFKGFNQTGVSEIISRTDPRGQLNRS